MWAIPPPHLPSNSQNQDNLFATFDPHNLHLNLHSLPQLQKITTQSQTQKVSLSLCEEIRNFIFYIDFLFIKNESKMFWIGKKN